MKRRSLLKSGFAVLCAALLLSTLLAVPVSANSAQAQWTGTDATGAIVIGGDCPIVVEKELLTFDIQEFPEQYYREISDYLAYSGKVTAEYTFYNPADYTVDTTLVFPFGSVPDYGHLRNSETDERVYASDTEKYNITIDGVAIEKTLRHSLSLFGAQFELDVDMARLHDNYMDDDFYFPDMPVTRYSYMPSGVDLDTYDAADAGFILSADPTKTKVLLEGQNGGRLLDDAVQIHGGADRDEPFILNVIGEPMEELPEWKFYSNGGCEEEIDGTMTLVSTETVTLKEFLLSEYDSASGILESDWYNAMVESMKYFEWEFGAIHSPEVNFDITNQLMRWYEYDISLAPGQRIVNTVTAPIYPSFDIDYEPPIYEYTYLLSPAQSWAEFGSLDIVVNTPYYMTVSGPEGFEYTNPGYIMHLDGLPEGELTFTLCSEPEPDAPAYSGYVYPEIIVIFAIGAIAVAAVIIVAVVRKKRNT